MAASSEVEFLNICHISNTEFKDKYTFYHTILGKGSFSVVHKGLNNFNKQLVAIKIIDKEKSIKTDKDHIKECYILEKLDHPNIMKIYNGLYQKTKIYLVTEFFNGQSLDKITKYVLSEATIKNLFKQMIDAIDYCHNKNIIHRDIKLENMMLKTNFYTLEEIEKSQLAIIDFGFASEQFIGEKFYNYIGTPLFTAPEILNNIPYSGREADVWSLGICLHLLASNKYPFYPKIINEDIDQLLELRKLILEESPIISKNITSFELEFLIQKMLEKDPKNRITIEEIKKSYWMN